MLTREEVAAGLVNVNFCDEIGAEQITQVTPDQLAEFQLPLIDATFATASFTLLSKLWTGLGFQTGSDHVRRHHILLTGDKSTKAVLLSSSYSGLNDEAIEQRTQRLSQYRGLQDAHDELTKLKEPLRSRSSVLKEIQTIKDTQAAIRKKAPDQLGIRGIERFGIRLFDTLPELPFYIRRSDVTGFQIVFTHMLGDEVAEHRLPVIKAPNSQEVLYRAKSARPIAALIDGLNYGPDFNAAAEPENVTYARHLGGLVGIYFTAVQDSVKNTKPV